MTEPCGDANKDPACCTEDKECKTTLSECTKDDTCPNGTKELDADEDAEEKEETSS